MEWDTELGKDSEVSVGGIIKYSGGQEAAHGGDQSGRRTVGTFGMLNELVFENTIWASDIYRGIGMDIDIVEIFIRFKELFPQRSEVEIGVGEEKEGDLELGVFGGGEVRE